MFLAVFFLFLADYRPYYGGFGLLPIKRPSAIIFWIKEQYFLRPITQFNRQGFFPAMRAPAFCPRDFYIP